MARIVDIFTRRELTIQQQAELRRMQVREDQERERRRKTPFRNVTGTGTCPQCDMHVRVTNRGRVNHTARDIMQPICDGCMYANETGPFSALQWHRDRPSERIFHGPLIPFSVWYWRRYEMEG